ncbi:hypothetical protein [Bacillus sp. SN10]|uniref:hypothetical protein n=1 Tax=Bacillus sp. SN10 TaxID=2056493 RepID=UPI000C33A69B|nr:hypothetical protein [Bacillus sp. SN10]PKJ53981.1 hypothetical protein CWE34_18105 [Bacillus sp. SN10]
MLYKRNATLIEIVCNFKLQTKWNEWKENQPDVAEQPKAEEKPKEETETEEPVVTEEEQEQEQGSEFSG